jgi:hypothetical protein
MNTPSNTSAPEPASVTQPQEQLRYAKLLDWGTRLGLLVLVLSFAAYVTGLLPGHVPVDQLSAVWGLPVAQYLAQTHTPTGWGWLALLGHGDVLGLAGIAWLAAVSVACLLALVPVYARRGDRVFVAICMAEVLVVALAASGILTGGH